MGEVRNLFYLWKKIFSSARYIIIVVAAGFIFYMLNGLILNIQNLKSFYGVFGLFGTFKVLVLGALQLVNQIGTFAAIGTILLSLMIGILISLLSYRYSMRVRMGVKGGIFGGIGLFLGVAAPGCAMCGIGLFSLLGLTSALAILPFNGHEVIILAIGTVGFSIIGISKKFYKGCDLSKNMYINQNLVEREVR